MPVNKIRDPLSEAFATCFAGERSLPAVNPFVVLQCRQFFKGPTTLIAGVGFFVSVVKHVLMVRLLEGERFTALGTRVGRFT